MSQVVYTGHKREKLSECFCKHRYYIKNKSENSELAKHFHINHGAISISMESHDKTTLTAPAAQRYTENKWI